MTYAWLRKNGIDKGSHSHIPLHIPEGLSMAFTRRRYRLATGWKGKVAKEASASAGRLWRASQAPNGTSPTSLSCLPTC